MTSYTVQYRNPSEDGSWLLEATFQSLEQAMEYASTEAANSLALEHRVCKMAETTVVVTLPPLGDHR